VTLILDAGGLSALAGRRGRLAEFLARNASPPQVPSVVLTEALTGDHHRDHHTNRLLRFCDIHTVDEVSARDAAIVVAFADGQQKPIILTSDPKDLMALAEHAKRPMTINAV
jgi:hypothetical protein